MGFRDHGTARLRPSPRLALAHTEVRPPGIVQGRLDRSNGLEDFSARLELPRSITLPRVHEVRPRPEYLRIGLEARRWPRELIR